MVAAVLARDAVGRAPSTLPAAAVDIIARTGDWRGRANTLSPYHYDCKQLVLITHKKRKTFEHVHTKSAHQARCRPPLLTPSHAKATGAGVQTHFPLIIMTVSNLYLLQLKHTQETKKHSDTYTQKAHQARCGPPPVGRANTLSPYHYNCKQLILSTNQTHTKNKQKTHRHLHTALIEHPHLIQKQGPSFKQCMRLAKKFP